MIDLYCFGESGNAYKAALALELAGLDWRPIKVEFFQGETRTAKYRRDINAMGEVPVMVDRDHDYWLTQSGAIQDYIVHLTGKLTADCPEGRREVLRWMLWDNHKLSSQAGMTRFLMNFLPEEKRNSDVNAFSQGRLLAALETLNTHLDGREWIVGSSLTIADLSCCSYLYYPEPYGFDRAALPHIALWLDRIAATPGWKHPYDLMPRALPGA